MDMQAAPTISLGDGIRLRAFRATDSKRLSRLASEASVLRGTLGLPNPYHPTAALEWIEGQAQRFADGIEVVFAIAKGQQLIGSVGLTLEREHQRCEIGYWLGRDFRGRGYATRAVQAACDFAHLELHLNRIYALCFRFNVDSQALLARLGFKREGVLRKHVVKDGRSEDVISFAHLAVAVAP
jgi:[ribosomal protein S5]-alanine N-acetyltransferase